MKGAHRDIEACSLQDDESAFERDRNGFVVLLGFHWSLRCGNIPAAESIARRSPTVRMVMYTHDGILCDGCALKDAHSLYLKITVRDDKENIEVFLKSRIMPIADYMTSSPATRMPSRNMLC